MAEEKVTEEVVEEKVAKKAPAKKNEVAKKEEAEVAISDFSLDFLTDYGFSNEELESLTGMENVDSSDIAIPYATLMSKDGTEFKKGDLVLPGGKVIHGWDGEFLENVSILNIQPVRVYFPSPFKPTNSFVCRSLDGKVGAPGTEYEGRACATCEFAQYPEEGGASPCRDQRLLLCATEDSVFQIIVAGVGMKVFRSFMTQQLLTTLPKVKNLWLALNLRLSVSTVETDFGPFPALNFELDSKNPINSNDLIINRLELLKSYKEFAIEHFDSAAQQSAVQMAVSEEEEVGENSDMF